MTSIQYVHKGIYAYTFAYKKQFNTTHSITLQNKHNQELEMRGILEKIGLCES